MGSLSLRFVTSSGSPPKKKEAGQVCPGLYKQWCKSPATGNGYSLLEKHKIHIYKTREQRITKFCFIFAFPFDYQLFDLQWTVDEYS